MMLGNILFFVVIGVVIYMMMKGGGGCCGGHDHGGKEGHGENGSSGSNKDSDHGHHHAEFEAANITTEKDPVCGMDIKNHSIAGKHLGRTFHFCSEQCRKVFDLNPQKYFRA
jgi:YHS domain-containing protein